MFDALSWLMALLILFAVFLYGGLALVLIARAAIIGIVARGRPKRFWWPEGGLALMLRTPVSVLMNPDPEAAARDTGLGGTELFERPDFESRVLCTLPEDAVVTYCNTESDFLRVETADSLVGYVRASACVPETLP